MHCSIDMYCMAICKASSWYMLLPRIILLLLTIEVNHNVRLDVDAKHVLSNTI